MKVIGITGGVGAGKSQVLSYIEKKYQCRILLADRVGNLVKEPGQKCYEALKELLGEQILNPDGTINREQMANIIFQDEKILQQVNQIIHPAVEDYIFEQIQREKEKNLLDYFFVEAALLIECGYGSRLDEMWYIYADESIRRERLKKSRYYSDDKIDSIMKKQLSEEEFRKHCDFVIDNSGEIEETYRAIDERLGE